MSYIRSAAFVAFYLINSPCVVGRDVVVFRGLIILVMVLRHLKSILTFVFLNMFVTLHICREMYVNIAHFCSCPCVLWCVLSYVLFRAEAFILMPVGKHYGGICVELLSILFLGVLN